MLHDNQLGDEELCRLYYHGVTWLEINQHTWIYQLDSFNTYPKEHITINLQLGGLWKQKSNSLCFSLSPDPIMPLPLLHGRCTMGFTSGGITLIIYGLFWNYQDCCQVISSCTQESVNLFSKRYVSCQVNTCFVNIHGPGLVNARVKWSPRKLKFHPLF